MSGERPFRVGHDGPNGPEDAKRSGPLGACGSCHHTLPLSLLENVPTWNGHVIPRHKAQPDDRWVLLCPACKGPR